MHGMSAHNHLQQMIGELALLQRADQQAILAALDAHERERFEAVLEIMHDPSAAPLAIKQNALMANTDVARPDPDHLAACVQALSEPLALRLLKACDAKLERWVNDRTPPDRRIAAPDFASYMLTPLTRQTLISIALTLAPTGAPVATKVGTSLLAQAVARFKTRRQVSAWR